MTFVILAGHQEAHASSSIGHSFQPSDDKLKFSRHESDEFFEKSKI